MINTPPEISVVIPLYNEEKSIPPLYDELTSVLETLDRPYEVIVIDDGSTDNSFGELSDIHARDSRWHIIQFRRNFGQTAGMQAGFDAARGDIVLTIDADLQNDPRDIPKIIETMEDGDYDIVSGWRKDRKEPFISRRLPSMLANRLISRTTGVVLHDYGCSLKAYRKDVIKNVQLYGELHRFIPALASPVGVRVTEVPVNDRSRRFGTSKYGIGRTFRVILDLIAVLFLLNYFQRPIHIFGSTGLRYERHGIGDWRVPIYSQAHHRRRYRRPPVTAHGRAADYPRRANALHRLVAEMLMRTYYESQGANAYHVRNRLNAYETQPEHIQS